MSEGLWSARSAPKSPRAWLPPWPAQTWAGRLGLLVVAGLLMSSAPAHAYIDPGSAGFVVTTVLGAIAAGGYLIRGWIVAVRRWVGGLRGGAPDDCSSAPCDAEPPSGSS